MLEAGVNHSRLEMILSEDEEQPHQYEKRQEVLSTIITLIDEWAVRILSQTSVMLDPESCAVKVFTFGSYRLGINDPYADIDTLCLVSRLIQNTDFWGSLSQIIANHALVTKFMIVPEAFVPVMKFYFDGIQIDMVFARFTHFSVPKNLNLARLEFSDLKLLDMKSLYSINGCRVTDEFYRLVPDFNVFKNAVRFIKKWAKARSIYSNSMGFLGGVSWAILVARVCQLHPNSSLLSQIILEVFKFIQSWSWPNPVLLNKLESQGPLRDLVWDPYYNNEDLMPIITPAYPAMNTTDKVSKSTKMIIMEEAKRAEDIVNKVLLGKEEWEALFKKNNFFKKYKLYLRVDCSTDLEFDALKGCGAIEASIPTIIRLFEEYENVDYVHPSTRAYTFPSNKPFAKAYFIGIHFKNVKPFQNNIILSIRYKLLEKKVKDPNITFLFRNTIPAWVFTDEITPIPTPTPSNSTTNSTASSPIHSNSPSPSHNNSPSHSHSPSPTHRNSEKSSPDLADFPAYVSLNTLTPPTNGNLAEVHHSDSASSSPTHSGSEMLLTPPTKIYKRKEESSSSETSPTPQPPSSSIDNNYLHRPSKAPRIDPYPPLR